MSNPIVNIAALEPLYAPHEEPNRHRIRAQREGEPAQIIKVGDRAILSLHKPPPDCQ